MEIISKKRKVGILDYGIGNLNSIVNAFERLGHEAKIINKLEGNRQLSHLVIPGVGAFGSCAEKLKSTISIDLLNELVLHTKIPTLGICVGMQLMCSSSEEDCSVAGLSWFSGEIKKLKSSNQERIPHVGWNEVRFKNDYLGFQKSALKHFYFDHAYAYIETEGVESKAICDYSDNFSAIISLENIIGVQFHPEKSQKNGAILLEHFCGL